MTCIHLRKLYEICESSEIRLSSADLVHIVCKQCGHKEVCPSTIIDEYEWNEAQEEAKAQAQASDAASPATANPEAPSQK